MFTTPDRRPKGGLISPTIVTHGGQGSGSSGGATAMATVASGHASSIVSSLAGSPPHSPQVSPGPAFQQPPWSPRALSPLGPPNPSLEPPLSPSQLTPEWLLRRMLLGLGFKF